MSRSDPPAVLEFQRCRQCRTPNPKASYLTTCLGCGTPMPVDKAGARPGPEARPRAPVTRPSRRRGARVVTALSWAYAGGVLLALALCRWLGDHWWLATAILYMPRAAFLAPLLVLGLAAAWTRRFSLWTMQGATLLVVLGPLMGASFPIWRAWTPDPPGDRWRIMSFNVGTEPLDLPALFELIERQDLHLICFQEMPSRHPAELSAYLDEHGWQRSGDGRIVSRFPILGDAGESWRRQARQLYPNASLTRVRVAPAPGVEIDVVSAHLPSIRQGLYTMIGRDPAGFQAQIDDRSPKITRSLGGLLPEPDIPLLVGADLNVPSESPVLDPVRPFFHNAFDQAGWGFGYTMSSEWPWLRIDHVLTSREFAITRAWVGPHLGSDHLPILAEVVLPEPR